MEKLPLINLTTGEPEWVKLSTILYGAVRNDRLIFHTATYEYSPISTLRDFTQLLQSEGFARLDKSNVVNIGKIVRYDSRKHMAYFDKTSGNDGITVSRRNRGLMRSLRKK